MAPLGVCTTAGTGIRLVSDTAERIAASVKELDLPFPLKGNGRGGLSSFRRTFPLPESALFFSVSETTLAVAAASGFRSGDGMGFLSFAVVAERLVEELLSVESRPAFDGNSALRRRRVLDLGRITFFSVVERED